MSEPVIGVVALFQVLYTYTPPFQFLFESMALEAHTWLLILIGGLCVFVAVEFEKWVRRRFRCDDDE